MATLGPKVWPWVEILHRQPGEAVAYVVLIESIQVQVAPIPQFVPLENFAGKYTGQLTITKDTGDFFCTQPQSIAARTDTLLVLSLGQLQKLGKSLHLSYAFTSDLGIMQLVELLHSFTTAYPNIHVITRHQNNYVVAVKGAIGTSPAPGEKPVWRVATAASAATWWLQNPEKPFEALMSSAGSLNSL
jgi:hypothetical protein